MIYKLSTVFILALIRLSDRLEDTNEKCYEKNLQYGNVVDNVLPRNYTWPNSTIVYDFHGVFAPQELANIRLAMEILINVSCLRFVKRSTENHHSYLVITNTKGKGCWADLGWREQGPTYLQLASVCTRRIGTILHELMHVLGFLHQHTRPDRDRYLCVQYDNIIPQPAAFYNYEIVEPWTKLPFPLPYDFESVTHYTADMYSVDPAHRPTMRPRHPWRAIVIGQREHLTDYDVLAIHFLYCL